MEAWNDTFELEDLIYHNSLASEQDVRDFILEGEAAVSFPQRRLRMENRLDPALGQKSNFVKWRRSSPNTPICACTVLRGSPRGADGFCPCPARVCAAFAARK